MTRTLAATALLAPCLILLAGSAGATSPIRNASREAAPVAIANRAATIEPTAQGFINAVQVYPFTDGAIYRVITAPERVTDIALQPGETLVAVASGDTARWVIGDTTSGSGTEKRTHILVKPFSAGLSTNLVITTDRRSYHIALTSMTKTAMAALSWTYPHDALITLRRGFRPTSRIRLMIGSSSTDAWPTQPASVERSISMPCAAIISAWR